MLMVMNEKAEGEEGILWGFASSNNDDDICDDKGKNVDDDDIEFLLLPAIFPLHQNAMRCCGRLRQ